METKALDSPRSSSSQNITHHIKEEKISVVDISIKNETVYSQSSVDITQSNIETPAQNGALVEDAKGVIERKQANDNQLLTEQSEQAISNLDIESASEAQKSLDASKTENQEESEQNQIIIENIPPEQENQVIAENAATEENNRNKTVEIQDNADSQNQDTAKFGQEIALEQNQFARQNDLIDDDLLDSILSQEAEGVQDMDERKSLGQDVDLDQDYEDNFQEPVNNYNESLNEKNETDTLNAQSPDNQSSIEKSFFELPISFGDNSVLGQKINRAQARQAKETPKTYSKIIADYIFLLGRLTTKAITDFNGNVLIPKNTLVTAEVVLKAFHHGRLLDLTKYSKA